MLLSDQGDEDAALRVYQEAIEKRIAYSGVVNEHTANLYNSLANTLEHVNRTEEALSAYRTTIDIESRLGRGEDPDSLITEGNMGVLQIGIGELREGGQVLKAVTQRLRDRAGDSEAVAIDMGLYGRTLTDLGRHAEAIVVLRSATDVAVKFAGAASPTAIQNRVLTDALTRSGQFAEATALSAANISLTREQFGEKALPTLRARRIGAVIDLATGHAGPAEAEFGALLEPMRKLGKRAELLVVNTLLGQGEARLAQGKAAEAVAPLREAVALRERQHLGDQHWELAVARCRLGEALKRSRSPGGTALLQQGVAVLVARLGDGHPEVERARRALAAS